MNRRWLIWLLPPILLLAAWLGLSLAAPRPARPPGNPRPIPSHTSRITPAEPDVPFQMPWAGYRLEAINLYQRLQENRKWHTPRQQEWFIQHVASWLQTNLPQPYPGLQLPPQLPPGWLEHKQYTLDDYQREYLLYKANYAQIDQLVHGLLQKQGPRLIPVIQQAMEHMEQMKNQAGAHGHQILDRLYGPALLERYLEKQGLKPPYPPALQKQMQNIREEIARCWAVEFPEDEWPALEQWLQQNPLSDWLRRNLEQQETSLLQEQWLRQQLYGWRILELHAITRSQLEHLQVKSSLFRKS